MENSKIRINISQLSQGGRGFSGTRPIDFDKYEDFVFFLKENNAYNISLGYFSIIDDDRDYHLTNISINDFTSDHFDWLSVKGSGQFRFVEYIKMNK